MASGGQSTRATGGRGSGPGPTPPRADALLERDGEVARLTELVRAAVGGEARVALVEGAAGIGKSRLLAEARRAAAAARMRVLAARGSELEREFPFGVVRQLFETTIADPQVATRAFAGAAESARPTFDALAGPTAAGGEGSFAAATTTRCCGSRTTATAASPAG